MKRLLCLAVSSLLCVGTMLAQDPVKVDPAHHKVVFEDEQVRVLSISFGPGEKAPTHSHPSAVAVFLTDSHLKQNVSAGKITDRTPKAGDAVWSEPFTHAPENVGGARTNVVLVEFKKKAAPVKPASAKESPDNSVQVDPKHYKQEFENNRARVIRASYGAGEKSVMHRHPRVIGIFLTDLNFTFKQADGTVQPSTGKAGDVLAMPAQTHLPENRGSARAQVILVEPK